MMVTVLDWWWEDKDVHVLTPSGEIILKNAYLCNVSFSDLDYNMDENITLVGNNKIWL